MFLRESNVTRKGTEERLPFARLHRHDTKVIARPHAETLKLERVDPTVRSDDHLEGMLWHETSLRL